MPVTSLGVPLRALTAAAAAAGAAAAVSRALPPGAALLFPAKKAAALRVAVVGVGLIAAVVVVVAVGVASPAPAESAGGGRAADEVGNSADAIGVTVWKDTILREMPSRAAGWRLCHVGRYTSIKTPSLTFRPLPLHSSSVLGDDVVGALSSGQLLRHRRAVDHVLVRKKSHILMQAPCISKENVTIKKFVE